MADHVICLTEIHKKEETVRAASLSLLEFVIELANGVLNPSSFEKSELLLGEEVVEAGLNDLFESGGDDTVISIWDVEWS